MSTSPKITQMRYFLWIPSFLLALVVYTLLYFILRLQLTGLGAKAAFGLQ